MSEKRQAEELPARCWQENPLTLVFEIDGWEAAVRYPTREAIEKAKSLIDVGPLAMRRGPGGEVLIFCGRFPGTLVALIRPDGVGKA